MILPQVHLRKDHSRQLFFLLVASAASMKNLKNNKKNKFSTMDILVPISRKNAANCDKQCELQNPRVIRFSNAVGASLAKKPLACLLQSFWLLHIKMWLNFGSLIEFEYDVFSSNGAVTVSDSDFVGSEATTSIERLVFQNNLKLRSSRTTRWT